MLWLFVLILLVFATCIIRAFTAFMEGFCSAQGKARSRNYISGASINRNPILRYEENLDSSVKPDPASLYLLGVTYKKGNSVRKSLRRAATYWEMAAEDEYPDAEREIAKCYEYGIGTHKSAYRALDWYHCYAEDDRTGMGLVTLGKVYEQGRCGVKIDFQKAIEFYEIAAEFGCKAGEEAIITLKKQINS